MTKKKTRKVCLLTFHWMWLFYITVNFFLGTADIFSIICMFVCYSAWSLILILSIIFKIISKIYDYQTYKAFVIGFEYLQHIYKIRYKLYFTGDREKIDEYSTEIYKYGKALILSGEIAISGKLLSKKHIHKVENILKQTKELMTT